MPWRLRPSVKEIQDGWRRRRRVEVLGQQCLRQARGAYEVCRGRFSVDLARGRGDHLVMPDAQASSNTPALLTSISGDRMFG